MNKKNIITAFVQHLETELEALKNAARATYEAATHEESKPENEYDTRAIEASYLAGAQAKRAGEIDEVLALFHHMEFKSFEGDEPISQTALIEVEAAAKKTFVLMMPKGGGVSMKHDGAAVQIITPQSMLGEALIGLKTGETAEVEVGGNLREYEILSVQ